MLTLAALKIIVNIAGQLGYTILGDCWAIGLYALMMGWFVYDEVSSTSPLRRLGPLGRPATALYVLVGVALRRDPMLRAALLRELEREVYECRHEEAVRLRYVELAHRVRESLGKFPTL